MASEPKTTRLILTSNTQATKKVELLNYVCTFQCHSNRSPQLFELKKKKSNKKTSHVIKTFSLCSCNAQYFHTTEHTYARLSFMVSLVDYEFSSKYYCVGLIVY